MTINSAPGGRAASAPLLGKETEPTIFELSVPGRSAYQLRTTGVPAASTCPGSASTDVMTPAASATSVV